VAIDDDEADEFPTSPEPPISKQDAAGGGNDAAEAIQIAERFNNTAQIVIQVAEANARLVLHKCVSGLRGSRDWLGPAGLFAGFFVSLLTSDFKKVLGVEAEVVQGITIGVTAALAAWTAVWGIRATRIPSTDDAIEDIIKGLKGESTLQVARRQRCRWRRLRLTKP
jgi:hypothetical protein